MMSFISRRIHSFRCALHGLSLTIRYHPNFLIHIAVAGLVFFLAAALRISRGDWLIILIVMIMVFVVELLNSAFETMIDLVTPEWRSEVKKAKDIAAAAMLVMAAGSAIVGIIIFWSYIVY